MAVRQETGHLPFLASWRVLEEALALARARGDIIPAQRIEEEIAAFESGQR